MPRGKGNGKEVDTAKQLPPPARFDFYRTTQASANDISQWDVKAEATIEAILNVLANGDGLILSRTRDGTSVALTLMVEEHKSRYYINDSIAWDDVFAELRAGALAWQRRNQAGEVEGKQAAD